MDSVSQKASSEEILNLRVVIVALIVVVLGFGAIQLSASTQSNPKVEWLLNSIGITLLSTGVLSVIYELYLRKDFLRTVRQVTYEQFVKANQAYGEEMKKRLITVIEKDQPGAIAPVLKDVIDDAMPQSYTNIREMGVVDAYPGLNIENARQRIKRAEGKVLRFMNIWCPFLKDIKTDLVKAIQRRSCTVEVLLLDSRATEALKKRAAALEHYNLDDVQREIDVNLSILSDIQGKVGGKGLIVKQHTSFIAASLFWYSDEEMLVGLYLRGRPTTAGIQLKLSGDGSFFFTEMKEHFMAEWRDAEVVDLEGRRHSPASLDDRRGAPERQEEGRKNEFA